MFAFPCSLPADSSKFVTIRQYLANAQDECGRHMRLPVARSITMVDNPGGRTTRGGKDLIWSVATNASYAKSW